MAGHSFSLHQEPRPGRESADSGFTLEPFAEGVDVPVSAGYRLFDTGPGRGAIVLCQERQGEVVVNAPEVEVLVLVRSAC